MQVVVAKEILKVNDTIAKENMEVFDRNGVYGINVLGSPGSGKTTLLEKLFVELDGKIRPGVIEGDLETSRDAERIDKLGVPVVQINTGGGCHLEANMVQQAITSLDLSALNTVFVENVGNLVCTSGYMLGERLRFVVLSTTEGDDKVSKYPPMFQRTQAMVINKVDLLEFTDFSVERAIEDARKLNPDIEVFTISARTGEGIPELAKWIVGKVQAWQGEAS